MRVTKIVLVSILLLFTGCAVRQVTPQQVAGRTIGGAAVGAAAGAVGGAVAGQPVAGAAAGATAGGLLGLLSSLFQIHVVDVGGTPYGGGGYSAPSYGGRTYTPEDFCSSFESPAEREKCEAEFKAGAERKRRQVERQIEQEARRTAAEQVRYSGTVPDEYCTNLYSSEAWREDACKRGLERGAQTGYRQRENDIRRQAREAGYGVTW